ncbi:AAA family ATPase [Cytobacillus kochii]
MKLHSLRVEGFRRHIDTEILFSDATFLIGSNNVGKSSILKALEYLLTDKTKMSESDFCCILNEHKENERLVDEVILTAEFRNVPLEAENWKGFNKQRLFKSGISNATDETGLSIFYRKKYSEKDCKVEMKQFQLNLKSEFQNCSTIQDYINAGLSEADSKKIFGEKKSKDKIPKKVLEDLKELAPEEIFDIDKSETVWFKNPGGIAGNVLSRLPKFLLIPDQAKTEELSGKKGALITTLNSLFEDVRDSSKNFEKAQYYLQELAKELDPKDEESDFSKMLGDLNRVVGDVFPETTFRAQANLSNPNEVITPMFDIQLGSNINTSVDNQGAGVIRSAIFAMLRYRSMRENNIKHRKNEYVRPLLVAFEEPEIYLHPKASQQMRDTIYELSRDLNNQIVATTHSPYMIDLSENSAQILNSLYIKNDRVYANPFNISKAFQVLLNDDKSFVKMLLKVDDSMAKVFFAKNVLIIEGDTEEVVIKETIARMPEELRKTFSYDWEIVKARGKAIIISLVKYLKALGITPYVIHDRDINTVKASQFNQPILDALGDPNRRIMLEECVEDILGYTAPSKDKPYRAYKHINDHWGEDWDKVNLKWKDIIEKLLCSSVNEEVLQEVASTIEKVDLK